MPRTAGGSSVRPPTAARSRSRPVSREAGEDEPDPPPPAPSAGRRRRRRLRRRLPGTRHRAQPGAQRHPGAGGGRRAVHRALLPLHDHLSVVDSVLEIGRRLRLDGWVLYPTRDEIVAAFSQHRDELRRLYRVPTPGWSQVQPAWDKRITHRIADRLGIATPRTWYARSAEELARLDVQLPVAVKPAIKERFIYKAKVKALRATTRDELLARYRQACAVIAPEEVMVQELIPGGGESQFSYCAFFKDGRPMAKMLVRRARQRPPDFARSSTCVET